MARDIIEISLSDNMSDDDIASIQADLEDFAAADGMVAANSALGGTYCVTCVPSGTRHTVQARNALSLFLKAVGKCGKGFQITKGPCR